MGERELHVLVSAYMCEPGRGSEPGKSWHWARHLAGHCRVTVLTQPGHRAKIEAALRDEPLPGLGFAYVPGPPIARRMPPGAARYHVNYVGWQIAALRAARELLARDPFDLAHHVSFASITRPIFMQRLPVPLIFGPVGGGELGHPAFRDGGAAERGYELLRTARVASLRVDPLVRETLRRAARIFVTTPETGRLVPAADRHKTAVEPSIGIESSLVAAESDRPPGRRVYAAGRLLRWKGLHLAIPAFARAAERYPDATFTIVGDGPQRAELEGLVAAHGVQGRVTILPWLPRAEVLRLAAESDIFMLPSLHDSGGMAVLEAMAAGKPVICLDSGGPSLVVTPESGVKVPLTSPDQVVADLAAGLGRLLADADLRARMGAAARRTMLERCVWERKAERMVAVYREVLGERAAAQASAPLSRARPAQGE